MVYPIDAKTIPFSNPAIGEIILLPAPGENQHRTILNATILNYKDNQTEESYIDCGEIRIAKAFYKAWFDNRQMSYLCNQEIVSGNSGALGSYGQIVYVDYDIASSTRPVETISGFSHGEIVATIFLFLIFIVSVYNFYWATIHEKIDKDI